MNLGSINNLKKKLKLTKKQKSILVGKLLGDGHLETQNKGKTYRLKVEHSIEQKEYIDWLYYELKNLANQKPQIKKRFNRKPSYWFTTYSLGIFRFYGQQFYVNGKKIIPKIIKKLLDPLVLAVWFMDDGSFKSNKHHTYILHTTGFNKKDLLIIKSIFQEKFGINVRLHKQYDKWRIYICSDSAQKFKDLISPYIIPILKYKLGNTLPKR